MREHWIVIGDDVLERFKRQVGDRILDHSCLETEKDLLVPTLGDAGR